MIASLLLSLVVLVLVAVHVHEFDVVFVGDSVVAPDVAFVVALVVIPVVACVVASAVALHVASGVVLVEYIIACVADSVKGCVSVVAFVCC